MREIKFRAWDAIEQIMLYPSSIAWNRNGNTSMCFVHDGTKVAITDEDPEGRIPSIVRDNFPLMQYTGLKDKNSREIYEGDIVKCNPSWSGKGHEIGEIYWNKMRGGFMVKVKRPTVQGFNSLKMAGATEKEVIGNIYENPELLK